MKDRLFKCRILVVLLLVLVPDSRFDAGAVWAQTTGQLTDWQISLNDGKTFQPVTVPGAVEDQLDPTFDGVSIYKTRLPKIELEPNQRLLIKLEGIATDATVSFAGQPVGHHLGAWTPFTIDLTDEFSQAIIDSASPELKIVVDEKVGHNTQGFLPIVTNHFGGIWKPVRWEVQDAATILDTAVAIRLDDNGRDLRLQLPLLVEDGHAWSLACSVRTLQVHSSTPLSDWQDVEVRSVEKHNSDSAHVQSKSDGFEEVLCDVQLTASTKLKRWSVDTPYRYEFRFQLLDDAGDESSVNLLDEFRLPVGFRDFAVDQRRFLLNGTPITIRGVLNWGYAPPKIAPSLDEEWMRNEIRFAQERGFNMMKFCLWVPPQRYLELCDEMGLMAWMEYPTWHPKLDQDHLAELRREYAEFYQYDRNHCSIVLRSLTCETGPSAELTVIQALYDQCKEFIPGAVLEDDSSWIQWNRVNDFYDDHPYGNNHSWVATLTGLKQHIADREPKPLALGEAIAADTWVVPSEKALQLTASAPEHGPMSIADALRWQNQIQKLAESRNRKFDPADLLPQSRHYGMLMRKFQIEAFQREVPEGAYVVSVIRDFRKAHMGLIDYFNQPKHSAADWSFQRDRMILLATENDRRSYESQEQVGLRFVLKNGASSKIESGRLQLQLLTQRLDASQGKTLTTEDLEPGASSSETWSVTLPKVDRPTRLTIRASWKSRHHESVNEWPVWVLPTIGNRVDWIVHPSAQQLSTQLPVSPIVWEDSKSHLALPILTCRLDADLLERLRNGGRVLMLPDGQTGSFPLTRHWFLRGAPVVLPRADQKWHAPFTLPRDGATEQHSMLTELQHFDLGADVIANMDHYLADVDPSLLLWDNHDLSVVKTHGLVFEMAIGKGTMLVSALNHTGQTNSVGRWLFFQFQKLLLTERSPHDDVAAAKNWQRLAEEVNRQDLLLHHSQWNFQPDPKEIGRQEKWFATDFDDQGWESIRIDQHWEGQGHAGLDHWAWYRKSVQIPADWNGSSTWLNFTGIDDHAIIYVNGEVVGTAGDIAKQETAFDARLSFDITRYVQRGKPLQITVAVYDWFGAGGIFRPVTLSNKPLSDNPPILK